MDKKRFNLNERTIWFPVAAAIVILPLIFGDGYYLNAMNFIAIYSIVAIGLCLLTGYGGQFALSHAGFFAIGAYASAILSIKTGLHPLVSILLAQVIAALTALGIGAVVLRLKGHYLSIATLAFTVIVEVLLKNLVSLTGGLQGLSSIPRISIGTFALDSDWRYYFIVWPTVLFLLLFSLNLVDSRIGRVFRTLKEGENIAQLFGVEIWSHKVRLFVLSSVYASIAGSLYAHYVSFVSPSVGAVMFAIEIVLAIAFGGYTMLWGAMLGVAAINFLNEYLTVFAEYKRPIYGFALIVIMLFFPNGLLDGLMTGIRRFLGLIKIVKGHPHA